MKCKKNILFVIAIFCFFVNACFISAEGKYGISLDFYQKIDATVLGVRVNGEDWTSTTDVFHSDDDVYTITIDFAPPSGINTVVLYDEEWNGKVTESKMCFKGCTYSYTVNNTEHKDMIQLVFTEGYVVNFETNGGSSIDSKVIEVNKKVSIPTDPVKSGYIFDGWFSDEGLSEKYNFNTPITKDITLYAKWTEKVYTYDFITGDNQELNLGNIKSFVLKIDGDYSFFDSIIIGGLDLVKDEDYVVSEGSTIITFTKRGISKLNTLSRGNYEIIVKYSNDKEATGNLLIDIENPKTADNLYIYIGLLLVSGIGLFTIYKLFKYRRN